MVAVRGLVVELLVLVVLVVEVMLLHQRERPMALLEQRTLAVVVVLVRIAVAHNMQVVLVVRGLS